MRVRIATTGVGVCIDIDGVDFVDIPWSGNARSRFIEIRCGDLEIETGVVNWTTLDVPDCDEIGWYMDANGLRLSIAKRGTP